MSDHSPFLFQVSTFLGKSFPMLLIPTHIPTTYLMAYLLAFQSSSKIIIMKKTIFALLLLCSSMAFAQRRYDNNRNNNTPPATVQQNFQRENPNQNAKWNYRNNEWHATYQDNNNRNVETYYDRTGRRRDSHIAWNRTDVPRDLDDRINKRYHTTNYNAVRIERPNSQPLFQISLNMGRGRNRTVYMDEQGRERQYSDHH